MAKIRQAVEDVLNKIKLFTVVNDDGTSTNPYVRVWNNQVVLNEDGKMESFPMPAFFVEIVNNANYEVIGQGYRSSDLSFRIHVVHQYYNDIDDSNYEQDLKIFDLRDGIIAWLTYFNATGCGPLTAIAEEQDYSHTNIYHYIIDFVCNFTDDAGSRLADERNVYVTKEPPTDIQVNVEREENVQPIPAQRPFIINY
jgi:hypothetical protein